jgi:hypothetical protein
MREVGFALSSGRLQDDVDVQMVLSKTAFRTFRQRLSRSQPLPPLAGRDALTNMFATGRLCTKKQNSDPDVPALRPTGRAQGVRGLCHHGSGKYSGLLAASLVSV